MSAETPEEQEDPPAVEGKKKRLQKYVETRPIHFVSFVWQDEKQELSEETPEEQEDAPAAEGKKILWKKI